MKDRNKNSFPSLKDLRRNLIPLAVIFVVFFRFGLLFEYHANKNVFIRISSAFSDYFSFGLHPLGFVLSPVPWIMGATGIVAITAAYLYLSSTRKNYRRGEEHGSSEYADLKREGEDLKDSTDESRDIILSKNLRLTYDTSQHYRNLNMVVFGGSGSGKTRGSVKPNLLQMYGNYVVTDPKGSLVSEIGYAFKKNGYSIKVLNLVDMKKSMKYNPFVYFRSPNDVLKFVNNLVKNTNNQKESSGENDFWEKAETALLMALSFFLLAVGRKDEQNIPMLMELIQYSDATEEDVQSQLDIMFEELDQENQEARKLYGEDNRNSYGVLAVRQYKVYKKAAKKTAQSILVSLGVRMAIFDIPEFSALLEDDQLDLESIGKPHIGKDGLPVKTVLFCIVSDNDSTFTFMASILYQQLFELLYGIADSSKKNRLPVHTTFVLDEFANQPQIPDFDTKIATMRSRGISAHIILQELTKFKSTYPKTWEAILGNCDTALFLGANFTAQTTTKYISEIIGASTVEYRSISKSKGANGGWSENDQLIQRPLLDPAELGRLPMDECIVLVRSKQVFRDKKYDLMTHRNIHLTSEHGMRFTDSIDEILLYDAMLRGGDETDDRFSPETLNGALKSTNEEILYVQT